MKIEDINKLTLEDINFNISDEKIISLKKKANVNEIVGQKRAIEALKMGINIKGDGYNIFVIGETGTGRRTAIRTMLKDFVPKNGQLQDIAYAYNFTSPSEPILLFFPKGKAYKFRLELQKTIKNIRKKISIMIKSGLLFHENNKIKERAELNEVENIAKFDLMLKEKGFKAISNKEDSTPNIFPLLNGKPISFLKLQKKVMMGKMEEIEFNKIKEDYYSLLEEFHVFLTHLENVEKKIKKEAIKKKNEAIKPIIKAELKALILLVESFESLLEGEEQKKNNKKLIYFIKQIEKDLYKKMNILSLPFKTRKMKMEFMERYDINIIYKNSKNKNYVVDEPITHFSDLFGTIEIETETTRMYKNGHMKIKEGAIHKALNGYIILRLDSLLKEEDAWEYLKNILLSGKIKIPSPSRSSHSSFILNPEAIKSVPKVIMIGDEELYNLLYQEEPDFYKLFKVCATFDSSMERNDENTSQLISLVSNLQKKQELLPLEISAYKRLVLFSSELTSSTLFLSTQFTKIADCLSEANYIAKYEKLTSITDKEILKAIEKKRYFYSLVEEKFLDMIKMKELIIQVKGKSIARINGLAVEETSNYSFGLPLSITAQVSCGMGGVIDIEKEVGLSGEIYDKAHLIITSLLRNKFLKHYPLCISASICSEQSYSFIDGDSASCAHFLALISAIGSIPMRQDIAVTGSLNQLGEVQPVGGISEKIKGFFATCKILGFSGKGGVIIPHSNKQNLFLNPEILEAIKEGYFNIWTIKTIDEAITLLSEMEKEEYQPLIEEKLKTFAKTIIEMNKGSLC